MNGMIHGLPANARERTGAPAVKRPDRRTSAKYARIVRFMASRPSEATNAAPMLRPRVSAANTLAYGAAAVRKIARRIVSLCTGAALTSTR